MKTLLLKIGSFLERNEALIPLFIWVIMMMLMCINNIIMCEGLKDQIKFGLGY